MPSVSISELTTYRWSFEQDAHQAKQSGFDALGVWRQKLSDFGEEKGIELLRDLDLAVSNLQWIGGFTGSDGRSYRDAVTDAVEAIELAGEMRAGALVCYSGARAGHTYNHARRLLVTALRELEPVARANGVALAIEPMHPGCAEPFTFLTSIDDTLDILAEVDSPYVKMVFDTYHLGFETNIVARCREIAAHVAVVHLGDAMAPPWGDQDRCLPGRGNLPLAEILIGLADGGYDGYYDIELLGENLESFTYDEIVAKSIHSLDRLSIGAIAE